MYPGKGLSDKRLLIAGRPFQDSHGGGGLWCGQLRLDICGTPLHIGVCPATNGKVVLSKSSGAVPALFLRLRGRPDRQLLTGTAGNGRVQAPMEREQGPVDSTEKGRL
jgi:hypothetical protein